MNFSCCVDRGLGIEERLREEGVLFLDEHLAAGELMVHPACRRSGFAFFESMLAYVSEKWAMDRL